MTTKIETGIERQLSGPFALRPAQVAALLAQPDCRRWRGRRDRCLLSLLALAGLRVSEACKLTHDNIEIDGRRIRLRFPGGKSGVVRTVGLPPDAARALRAWISDPRCHRHWLFAGRRNEHLTPRAVALALDNYTRAAGLPRCHPHTLRHSFATALMRKSNDLHLVQKLLGHRSPAVTERFYLAWMTTDVDRAADLIGEVMHPAGGQPRVRRSK